MDAAIALTPHVHSAYDIQSDREGEADDGQHQSPRGYREITAPNGRVYRVGEDPRELTGRSRSYMVWLPWVAMMAAGIFDYAYGSAAKTLQATYGWSSIEAFTLTGVWGFFQAGLVVREPQLRGGAGPGVGVGGE
jgi:hypothetical protein